MTRQAPGLAAAPSAPSSTPTPAHRDWPVLRLGFRPFYLGAALFAMLAVPFWVAVLLGHAPVALPVPALWWHAHEMLFGFAVAVIVGFLLTAGKAWTGLATPRGGALAALFMLWLAARLAGLLGSHLLYAALDLLLLPVMAAILTRLLLRAGNRRNLPLALMLALLSLANLAFHLAVMGIIDVPPLRALHAGLALVVMIECVIAGRVIPAFTMGAFPGLRLQARQDLETGALSVTALALALWVLAPPGPATAAAFTAAALLHLLRMLQWKPWQARSRPILWVLHAAYAWVPMGFVLLAAAQVGLLGVSAGVHALAVGATGGLIIGMLTRTARGHTGRPLRASRPEVLAYLLVTGTALLRVLLPLAAPAHTLTWLVAAAVAWSTAFGIYLFVFAPWLLSARLDGKDG